MGKSPPAWPEGQGRARPLTKGARRAAIAFTAVVSLVAASCAAEEASPRSEDAAQPSPSVSFSAEFLAEFQEVCAEADRILQDADSLPADAQLTTFREGIEPMQDLLRGAAEYPELKPVADDLDLFLETRPTALELRIEQRELIWPVANGHAEHGSTVGHDVEHGCLLGHHGRMIEGQHKHVSA